MRNTHYRKIRVWDLFVRSFHWSLVLSVTIAAVTGYLLGGTWISVHIWAGTTAAVLLFARILWGIWGGTNARFANFVKGPKATFYHLRELVQGKAKRHLGHNPLGALMILALLGTVSALVISGVLVLGGIFKTGPLGFAASFTTGVSALSLHYILATGLLALVVLHVLGALFEGVRTRENLVASMVSGTKEARPMDHVTPVSKARPALVAFLLLAGLGMAFIGGTVLADRPVPNMPVTVFDPTYADECSACHVAYNPSLISGKGWSLLMSDLPNHFGEDASLDPATTEAITTWLLAHSANTVDTKPAHVLYQPAPDAPFTITKTPFWQRTHHSIAPGVFTRAPIYDNGNCAACHADADSGLFYPANISIPKETTR